MQPLNVQVGDPLNWGQAVAVRIQLKSWLELQRSAEGQVHLDLSGVTKAYPNGTLPLISDLHRCRQRGCRVAITEPTAAQAGDLLRRHGWLDALLGQRVGGDSPNRLIQFRTPEEQQGAVRAITDRCLGQLECARDFPDGLEWVIGEITDNVLNHSSAGIGWIQALAMPKNQELIVAVCDPGVGIPTTVRRRYGEYSRDVDALEVATRPGVTGRPELGQGNGLAGTVAIAQQNGAELRISSGGGRLIMEGGVRPHPSGMGPKFLGTFIELQLRTQKPIDLKATLGPLGHSGVGFIETNYEGDAGELTFPLREYAQSFGNRALGAEARQRVLNLMKQRPGAAVRIDMSGIGVISTGFADELFGKLAVELGPVNFGRLVSLDGISEIARHLVDRSIAQRLAQEAGPVTHVRRAAPAG